MLPMHMVVAQGTPRNLRKLSTCMAQAKLISALAKGFEVVFRLYQLDLNGGPHPVYKAYRERYPHFVEKGVGPCRKEGAQRP